MAGAAAGPPAPDLGAQELAVAQLAESPVLTVHGRCVPPPIRGWMSPLWAPCPDLWAGGGDRSCFSIVMAAKMTEMGQRVPAAPRRAGQLQLEACGAKGSEGRPDWQVGRGEGTGGGWC